MAPVIDRYGASDGPLVLLVHGAAVNRATMAPLALAIGPHVRVWVPDLPGHGARRDRPFDFDVAVSDLRDLAATAGHERVVFAGDSLGGYVALAAARGAGSRLAGVVAGGCSFPLDGIAGVGAVLTDLPVRALARFIGERTVEEALLRAFTALGGPPDVAARTAMLGMRLAARTESIAALRRFDLAAAVRAIDGPLVFINGDRDVPIVWLAEHYARIAPNARAVRIRGVGHGVMAFASDAVAREIRSLLLPG